MPRGGSNKKPRNLKDLEGTFRADRLRPVPQVEGETRMPRWLSGYAKSLWKELAPQLRERGLLTPLDRAALTALCLAYQRVRSCEEVLEREGFVLGGKKHPASGIQTRAFEQFRHLMREFGLTPASRATLDLPEPAGDDDFLDTL